MSVVAGSAIWLPQLASASTAPPCGDDTFSITHITSQDGWYAMRQTYGGTMSIEVTTGSPGDLVVSDASGKLVQRTSYPFPPGSDTYLLTEWETAPNGLAGSTDQYTLNFYPGISDVYAQQNLTQPCQLADGSLATTGPTGTYHPAPITMTVTWLPGGEGAIGKVNGVTVPGSDTYTPVSSAVPALAVVGSARVGQTLVCSVTPAPEARSAWVWDWTVAGKTIGHTFPYAPKFVVPLAAYGQALSCGGTNNGLNGAASHYVSSAVTVGPGTLMPQGRPIITGIEAVGHRVGVSPEGWVPSGTYPTTYQWYVGSSRIKGATQNSYKVPAQDKGKILFCQVTARTPGYTTGVVMSKPSFRMR